MWRHELGSLLGVSAALVSGWEAERAPIPAPWRAAIRHALKDATVQAPTGAELRAGRKSRGWSQGTPARMLGVSQGTVSGWVHGSDLPL
ncbi:MAG: helix-turn-helix domain-containing protein [Ktedonobacterales bacterium]